MTLSKAEHYLKNAIERSWYVKNLEVEELVKMERLRTMPGLARDGGEGGAERSSAPIGLLGPSPFEYESGLNFSR